MNTKTIAIIGAGFCGSTLAVHLLRPPSLHRLENPVDQPRWQHRPRGYLKHPRPCAQRARRQNERPRR